MEGFDYIELLQTLESLRPKEYINMVISSTMRSKILPLKYDLLKYWTGDKRSRAEFEEYLPNITFRQMDILANFYYPIPESIGIYPYPHLFYNAIKAGYSDDDCKQFLDNSNRNNIRSFEHSQSYCAISAYIHNRKNLLALVAKDSSVANVLLDGTFTNNEVINDFTDILGHPEVTIGYFCDLLYILVADNPTLIQLLSADPDKPLNDPDYRTSVSLFAESGHPKVIALQKKLGVTPGNPNRTFDQNTLEDYPPIAVKCELYKREYPGPGSSDWVAYHNSAVNELSRIDSVLFPTYDLNNDIYSGNWLEVIHKVNTYDRNVILSRQYTYNDSLIYEKARLETYGQMLLNLHPREVRNVLDWQGLKVTDRESAQILLQRWCFPNLDVSEIPDPFIYDKLADYYHPLAIVSDKWTEREVPIILGRLLLLDATKELAHEFFYTNKLGGINSLSVMILLHAYGFDDVDTIDAISEQYLNTFTGGELLFNNDDVYAIANTTYLDIDTKLDVLSRVRDLHPGLVKAILGYQANNPINVMGNLLNINASDAALQQFATVHDKQYVRADIKKIAQYMKSQVELLRGGKHVSSMFPLQLVWQYTNLLPDSDTYEESIIYLLKDLPYDELTTEDVLTAAGKFYDLLTGSVQIGTLEYRRFTSRFAC